MSKISNLASNAILAKARAMSAGLLTEDDYSSLINCRNVNEIVSYLKANTIYSNVESLSSNASFSKARVETEIRKYNYEKIASLASFEKAIGQKMNEIIYLNYDISLILSCADHLDTNKVSDFSLFTPQSYFKHSQVNPIALEMAMSFEEFYSALEGTEYQKALDIFKNTNKEFNITALENALYQYMCTKIGKIIKKNFSGKAKDEFSKIFMMKSDFKMIESIYRMKKYFPNEPCSFDSIFYSGLSAFSPAEINAMLECANTNELFDLLKKSIYGKYLDEKLKDNIEKCTHNAQLKINRKNLLFSTVPEVTMFSYIGILETESKNLVMITEGVDYGLTPNSISEFLVI